MRKNKLMKTIALTLALSSLGSVGASAAEQPYWRLNNNNWYYYDSNGKVKTGWIYDKGNWYYCYSSGIMARNTTIDGYYLNSNGAWSLNRQRTGDNALTADDIQGTHELRSDIGSRTEDMNVAQQLSSSNLSLNSENELLLQSLNDNLVQSRITISEARNNCIGKVINNKYRIKNILLLTKDFELSTGLAIEDEISAIKKSDIYSYNPSTTYRYDKYNVFQYSVDSSASWVAMRVIIELEAI